MTSLARLRFFPFLGQLTTALICLGVLACAGDSPPKPPNLILVTLDTLRADHLGLYGYFRDTSPNLDRFVEDALVFDRAVAPMPTTLPTHVSLFTSAYPVRHGIVSNFRFFFRPLESSAELPMLAESLAAAGYATAAFTSSSPVSAATGIGHGFETFEGPGLISIERGRIDQRAGETVEAALTWLQQADKSQPFFLWVHLFDPHDPYDPPPEFRRFQKDERLAARLEELGLAPQDREKAAAAIDAYDGEILYTDAQLGRLLDLIQELALDKTSLIAIVGDHGEGLFQHGVPRHEETWNEQLYVPWILRAQDGPRGRYESVASLIDLLPTLAGLGLPLNKDDLDGIDLLNEERRYALSQSENRSNAVPSWTLISRDWKFWALAGGEERLYHLASDPHELRNVLEDHPEVASEMRTEIKRLIGQNRQKSALPLVEEIPADVRRQLEALGYVE